MADGALRPIRDVAVGARAALRAPRLIDSSLRALLAPPDAAMRATSDCTLSMRVALRALRVLARVPGARWRNTCLFRSVAECDVRRAHGWPARLVIGVGSADDEVVAHSWVEIADVAAVPGALLALRRAGVHDGVD